MENAIGIDLGTTFSVVAHFDKDGRCRTLPNAEGDLTTPSVVYFDTDRPIVGKEAAKAGAFEPDRCATLAKRDMGKNHYHREILGQSLPPEVIQAIVLQKLRSDARMQLGEVTQAVITVPAYFNEPRRKATQDAGRLAGLEVLDIINEPTAAAIAFGVQEGFLDTEGQAGERELVLVYDLGGGTFDATLMEIEGGSYRALATGGDVHLGGVDWDQRIVDFASDRFQQEHGTDPRADATALQELRREAEDVKRALTARSTATMHVAYQGKRLRVEIDRDKLKELTDDLTSRTIFTCKKVLSDAKRQWVDVTRVLAVGGSSRMLVVQDALEAESGMKVDRSLSADEAVAHGAAIHARLKSGAAAPSISSLKVTNVSSHDLGVLGVERATGMPRRKVLIPRNTPLPAEGAGRFVTREDGQPDIAVRVIEGGDAGGNHATPIGRFLVDELPKDLKKGSPIVVRFSYRDDGRLDVAAKVADVEGAGTMTVERAAGLNDAEIALWKGRIDRNQAINQPRQPAPAAQPPTPVPSPVAAPVAAPLETATPAASEIVSTTAVPAAEEPAAAEASDEPNSEFSQSEAFDELLDSPEFDLLDDDAELLGEDNSEEPAPESPAGSPAPATTNDVVPAVVVSSEVVPSEVVPTEVVSTEPVPTAAVSTDPSPAIENVVGPDSDDSEAGAAGQFELPEQTPQDDPGSFDFLADQDSAAKTEDDGDLQDFLSGLP